MKKAEITLELPKILEKLSELAVTDEAKNLALKLEPLDDADEIKQRLDEVSAAKEMSGIMGRPSFYGVRNLSQALDRAGRGGLLNMKELLDIAANFRAARLAKAYFAENSQGNCLAPIFSELIENPYFENKITTAVISEDEMSDLASSELAAIRRKIRISGEKAREVLNKIITSQAYRKALQEPIITLRGDRFVVPVKSEFRSSISGLVHDVSSTGATVFVEPTQVVELNNEIRVLSAKEAAEIERILYEFSAEAANFAGAIENNFRLLTRLDLIFAKAELSYNLNATQPIITDKYRVSLKKARHPLIEGKKAVPIDVNLGGDYDTLVITGPNTGGKTVTLKTVGLLCLMAACGLHVPCDELSEIPVFRAIYADIGDEQSISQSLSTFSAHIKNIIDILKFAGSGCLVLLDELGAGTDPVEGAALAVSIIEHARKNGALVAATTHYAELKAFAVSTLGVENASCEFDVATLKPTYRLIIGTPGKSNAFAISERLGLDREIIADAERRISGNNKQLEDTISKLEQTRARLETKLSENESQSEQLEILRERAEREKLDAERESERILDDARQKAREILKSAQNHADFVLNELGAIKRGAKDTAKQNLEEARAIFRGIISEEERKLIEKKRQKAMPANIDKAPLKAGDDVIILKTNTRATVLKPVDKDGKLLLQAGILQITAAQNEVVKVKNETVPQNNKTRKQPVSTPKQPTIRSAATELDIRGLAADEAILELDSFIDSAVMSGLNTVTVIHGKGTGVLRNAVHERLRQLKYVSAFRLGQFGEGENGVTIVELK